VVWAGGKWQQLQIRQMELQGVLIGLGSMHITYPSSQPQSLLP